LARAPHDSCACSDLVPEGEGDAVAGVEPVGTGHNVGVLADENHEILDALLLRTDPLVFRQQSSEALSDLLECARCSRLFSVPREKAVLAA
jgi:hypothetical protein